MQPSQYSVRKLIAVSGMSPQIVTETLYALATREKKPFIPTEVHIITTTDGAQNAELNLLRAGKDKKGWFNRLCQELGLSGIEFSRENIHVIVDADNNPLSDIKTPEDNEAAASFITEFIRTQSQDGDAALHVSIAGGRKTMGYYLGYALSLFGREQDRLSHVLVSEAYEGNPSFYYPTQNGDIIFDNRGGKNIPLDPAQAKVMLADIPFLRINNDEAKNTMVGFSFSDTVRATQELLNPATLQIDSRNQLLIMNSHELRLQDQRFAFYCWIIDQQLKGQPLLSPFNKQEQFRYSIEFLSFYEQVKGEMGTIEKTEAAFKDNGMTKDYVSQTVTRINEDIKKQLGNIASIPFLVEKQRGVSHPYRVTVSGENIDYL